MSYIIWDGDNCNSFKTAKEAWAYLAPILKEEPLVAEEFKGFGPTVTNTYNRVAVLRNYDTKKPWDNAPDYMRPKEPTEPKPNTAADEAPSLDELLELLQHSKSPLLDFNKQRIRNLFKQAIADAERRGVEALATTITNNTGVSELYGWPDQLEMLKEWTYNRLQANAGGGERDE